MERLEEIFTRVMYGLSQIFGRVPMTLADLVQALHQAEWPLVVEIRPEDFWVISTPGVIPGAHPPTVYRDHTGPYFYVGRTVVRPVKDGAPERGSLLEWTSSAEAQINGRVILADFADAKSASEVRHGMGERRG